MTFCVGMKLKDGLVGLADTLIITGNEGITAKKISIFSDEKNCMFLMTSGLRSVRDKALTYFNESLNESEIHFDKVYKAVNAFANELRKVREEDIDALEETGLTFNLFTIIGGQFENDPEPKLFLLYPQGNWVEIGVRSPYVIIGETKYGKPIIKRTLTQQTSMETALKIAYLAFDSTRINAIDVDFPIDIVLYKPDSFEIHQYRKTSGELSDISKWWQERLRQSAEEIPAEWIKDLLDGKIKK